MYDNSIFNKTYTAASKSVNIRKTPSSSSAKVLTLPAGNVLVATGNVLTMKDGKWIQFNLIPSGYGYARADVIKELKVNGDTLAKMLIASDKLIFESLTRSSVYLQKKQAEGKDITAQKAQLMKLFNKLTARQNFLKTSSLVSCQTGLSKAYTTMTGYLKNLFGISGIGEPVSISVVIVCALVAGVGISILVYQLFKPKYDESKADLKVSADFENLLKKADPATATKIKKDLEKQVDDAYNQGNTDGTFGSFGSMLKYAGIAVVAIIGFKAIQKKTT